METLDQALCERERLAGWYNEAFADLQDELFLPQAELWAKPVYWMYTVFLRSGGEKRRDAVMRCLDAEGIETRPVFYPLHILPPYREEKIYPVADDWACRGINLPTHQYLTLEDVKRITTSLKAALKVTE